MSRIPTHTHTTNHRAFHLWTLVAILLVAAAFRFAALNDAPPGWRDDELIEFDMDARIRDGWRPLYITEAEGHEPLYHYLHAATIGLFGENIVGYRWLPMAFGVLTVALTYALARRLFGVRVAIAAAALTAVSFWPIMYARLGVRHIGLLPWMLGVYLAINRTQPERSLGEGRSKNAARIRVLRPFGFAQGVLHSVPLRTLTFGAVGGLCLAAGLLTYFAGRVVPVVVALFAVYLLLWHRRVFRRVWLNILIVLLAGAVLAAPMFVEVNRLLPGGEQRLDVVGPQLNELLRGNLQPAVETAIGTLGMFTFQGDPEALYNVEGRPVFDWLTGAFFYIGLAVSIWRWKRIEYAFTLIAFGLGIAPAFISNPPASFSHTIAVMPFAYVLAGLGVLSVAERVMESLGRRRLLEESRQSGVALSFVLRRPSFVFSGLVVTIVFLNGALTMRDYFGTWAQDSYVRFLYHAPTRQIARWLDETPEVRDVAIATHSNYLWLDPLALRLDLKREDVRARWFDAETTIVYPASGGLIVGTTLNAAGVSGEDWLDLSKGAEGEGFAAWRPVGEMDWPESNGVYGERITLHEVSFDVRDDASTDSDTLRLRLNWQVEQPIAVETIKAFVHLADARGSIVSQFDGMGVYLPSLQAGDRFIQFVRLPRPADALEPLSIRIGLYDSATNARLRLPDGRDFVTIDLP